MGDYGGDGGWGYNNDAHDGGIGSGAWRLGW